MKLAYNITYVLDPQYVDNWRQWMKKEYLPKLMDTGCFLSYRLYKLIGLPGSDEPTFSVQLLVENKTMLERYQNEFEPDHSELLYRHFKDKLLEFCTTMVIIDEADNC